MAENKNSSSGKQQSGPTHLTQKSSQSSGPQHTATVHTVNATSSNQRQVEKGTSGTGPKKQ